MVSKSPYKPDVRGVKHPAHADIQPDLVSEQAKQIDFLMNRERQKDLTALTCALASNHRVWPDVINQPEIIVNMAEKLLTEIEKRCTNG